MKTAAELFEITRSNIAPIESILSKCERAANNGEFQSVFAQYFDTETISKLGNLGFMIRKTKGQFGELCFIVSWED